MPRGASLSDYDSREDLQLALPRRRIGRRHVDGAGREVDAQAADVETPSRRGQLRCLASPRCRKSGRSIVLGSPRAPVLSSAEPHRSAIVPAHRGTAIQRPLVPRPAVRRHGADAAAASRIENSRCRALHPLYGPRRITMSLADEQPQSMSRCRRRRASRYRTTHKSRRSPNSRTVRKTFHEIPAGPVARASLAHPVPARR